MSRTVPASIAAQQAGTKFTLATCVKLILRDGTVYTFTDLDDDIDIGTFTATGSAATYVAGEGVLVSDIEVGSGLYAGTTELTMPIGSFVKRGDVVGRRFNQATVLIFWIDHSQDTPIPLEVMKGTIGEARVAEGRAIFEVRDLFDRYHVSIGRVLTPRCTADFADAQCGLTKTEIGGVVVAASSNMQFTTSIAGSYADQHFRFGEIRFTTGELAGLPAREVVAFTGASGLVEVFDPFPAVPAANDAFVITRGCSRLKSSTDPLLPTCLSYDNVTRFRGFDRVPGSDTYLKVPVPTT